MIAIKSVQEISLISGFKESTKAIKKMDKESEIDFEKIFNNEIERLKGVNTVENHENRN